MNRYLNVSLLAELLDRLTVDSAVLVTVQSARGSVPRGPGTWMAVFASTTVATVGGGHLEYDAMAHARRLLLNASDETVVRYALGPQFGSMLRWRSGFTF